MEDLIIVRGGGDIATGVIHRLWDERYNVLILEIEKPAAIRRAVSFCEAIYEEKTVVEGVKAVRIHSIDEMEEVLANREVPVLVDERGDCIHLLRPSVVIDGILAKKNMGTSKNMASLTIGLGPGFIAGEDVDVVIETMRGDTLGNIITTGSALPNTGVPGLIGGYDKERVIHATGQGMVRHTKEIGDIVYRDEKIGTITNDKEEIEICATIDGVLRGFIREGYLVHKGFKIADIDPRMESLGQCDQISDKAKIIGESVVNVINKRNC